MKTHDSDNDYDASTKGNAPVLGEEGLGSIRNTAINVGASVSGALVGLALGGVPGSVLGAAATPVLEMSARVFRSAWERRRERASLALERGLLAAKLSPEDAIQLLDSDESLADALFGLLRLALESDPATDLVLSALIADLFRSSQATDRERLLIFSDAVRNLRSIHIRVLHAIHVAGGRRSASDIAVDVGIPAAELRSVVRDLELRGMIKDLEVHPVEWRIRELGVAIVRMTEVKIGASSA